jgi:hypothetical protein
MRHCWVGIASSCLVVESHRHFVPSSTAIYFAKLLFAMVLHFSKLRRSVSTMLNDKTGLFFSFL